MAALNISSLEDVKAGSSAERRPRPLAHSSSEPVAAALAALLEALNLADDLNQDRWQFAVEIFSLHRLGVSNSGLRWLVARGMVSHGIEITAEQDAQRVFQRPAHLVPGRTTCFVLTPEGAAAAQDSLARDPLTQSSHPATTDRKLSREHSPGESAIPPTCEQACGASPLIPDWDRNRLQLRVGEVVVAPFKLPDADQEQVLATFAEQGWPARIESPAVRPNDPASMNRLTRAIAALNRRSRPARIHFDVDESGGSIGWQICEHRSSDNAR